MHVDTLIRSMKAVAALCVLCSAYGFSHSALAATLSLSPGTGVYTAGQTFTANVVINTAGQPVNAADATLSFNPNELSVVGVSKGSSIFNLWTADPTYSNSAGTISFGGGSPSGYTGSRGTIMTITFRASSAGTGRVSFKTGSVLAADGRGTNVLTDMSGGTYTIAAADVQPEPEVIEYVAPANTPGRPAIESSTHSDPNAWYNQTTAKLSWILPSGVTSVRTQLDENSGTIPTKVYENPISSIELTDLEEGVQYFHLQFQNADGWGRVAHYRLAVDTKNPERFEIRLPENADLSNPEQTLILDVEDETSLVTRFNVQVDGAEPFEYILEDAGSSTITLPPLAPGHHTVLIEAFDAAGNSIVDTLSFSILAFDKPTFTEYPSQLNEGVIPVIKGQTRPNSEVTIRMSRLGDAPAETSVIADESGVFTFIPDGALRQGVYTLTAVAIDEYGAQSEASDEVRIAVQQAGYVRIGSFIVSILSIIVPLLGLLVLMVVGMWYAIARISRLRRKVALEAGEALDIVQSEFAVLHEALRDGEQELVASKKTKKLSKGEEKLLADFNQSLIDSQARIEKEVTDVTKLVKRKR